MTTARELQVQRDAQADVLKASINGKVCATCDGYPFVAWIQGEYRLRCNCWPKPPVLASEYERTVGRRLWDMTTNALAKLDETGIKTVRAEVLMQEVKSILPGAAQCSPAELQGFVRLCIGLGANPFIGDAYLIKYQANSPAAFVVGLQYDLKRAARNPAYQGYKAGLVLQNKDGAMEYREGSLSLAGEVVVGAWCEVHRKGWAVAPKHTVGMAEYNNGLALWRSKPNTMIMKVAVKQAIRRAFPEEASETERQVAAVGVQVLGEEQAGVDLDDAPKALTEPPPPPVSADSGLGQEVQFASPPASPTPPAPRGAGTATTPPRPTSQTASDEFWPKVREQHPKLDSATVLTYLGVTMFTAWKGTVDEALAKVAERAKAPAKTGG